MIARLLFLMLFVFSAASAHAERRIALVVGNDAYRNLPADEQLTNAVNDARALRTTLQGLGFEVVAGENLDRVTLVERLSDFAGRLQPGDIAFFFFAGHGVSMNGANYILPSDIPAPRGAGRGEEERLADNALSEARIVERMRGSGAVAVVALDACRNNPLAAAGGRSLGGARGLGRMPEADGLMSIYSAGVGQVAWDRLSADDTNPNSVFTRVFVDVLKTPGLDLRGVAVETRRRVADLARGAGKVQSPGYYEQLDGTVYLAGPPKAAEAVAPAVLAAPPPVAVTPVPELARAVPAPQPQNLEQADFADAMQQNTAARFADFLSRHPTGPLADIARRERTRLSPEPAPPAKDTEQADFANALQQNSVAGFKAFLDKHPAGALADVARREQDRLAPRVAAIVPAPTPPPPAAAPVPVSIPAANFAEELTDFGVRPRKSLERNVGSPTPLTIPGARTIATADLTRTFNADGILIDVLKSAGHPTLPNAVWLPGAGDAGAGFNDLVQWKLGTLLRAATQGNPNVKLAFFCQGARCWESYNAALRAVQLGYRQVYWYRGGLASWAAAGLPTRYPSVTQAVP